MEKQCSINSNSPSAILARLREQQGLTTQEKPEKNEEGKTKVFSIEDLMDC